MSVAEGSAAHDHGEPSLSTAATIVQMLTDTRLSRAIYTAAHLRLADVVLQLCRGSTVPLANLATELRLDPSALRQLLCCLADAGVFWQESDHEGGRYSLNPLARHLLSESPWSLRNAVLTYGEEMALGRRRDIPAAAAENTASRQGRWNDAPAVGPGSSWAGRCIDARTAERSFCSTGTAIQQRDSGSPPKDPPKTLSDLGCEDLRR
jgi:hypothetical protein